MRRFIPLLLLAVVPAARAEAPVGAAYVPADAALVVQVRLADLWKSDSLKDFRRVVAKAGPKALETLDKRFSPAPSTAESVTAYVIAPAGRSEEPSAVVLFTFSKAFDPAAVLKQAAPKAKAMKGKQSEWHGDEGEDYGMMIVGDRTFAFGSFKGIARLADEGESKGSAAIPELADAKKLVVIAGNLSAIPPQVVADVFRAVPPAILPLLKAKSVVISLDGETAGNLHARIVYPDTEAADAADKALKDGIELGKGFIAQAREELSRRLEGDGKPADVNALPEAVASVLGLGALQEADDILANLPLKRTGDTFVLTVPIPAEAKPLLLTASMSAGLLLPAVQKVRQSANRMKSSNNLKQMALALIGYSDAMGYMPAAICDAKNKPLLSWRVAILPYIEQDNLYKQFKLDEPWDSDNNKKLIEQMPKLYEIPADPKPKAGQTYYRTFVGEGTAWKNYGHRARFPASIQDGTSNTWMVAEAGESVVWTKPDEIAYDGKTAPKLGTFHNGGFNIAFWDGSVRYYAGVPKGIHKYINPNDGEVITADDEEKATGPIPPPPLAPRPSKK